MILDVANKIFINNFTTETFEYKQEIIQNNPLSPTGKWIWYQWEKIFSDKSSIKNYFR